MERNSALGYRVAFRGVLALSSLLALLAVVDPGGIRAAFL